MGHGKNVTEVTVKKWYHHLHCFEREESWVMRINGTWVQTSPTLSVTTECKASFVIRLLGKGTGQRQLQALHKPDGAWVPHLWIRTHLTSALAKSHFFSYIPLSAKAKRQPDGGLNGRHFQDIQGKIKPASTLFCLQIKETICIGVSEFLLLGNLVLWSISFSKTRLWNRERWGGRDLGPQS